MKRWKDVCAGVAMLGILAGTPALAQQPQQAPPRSTDCAAKTPAKVDGQVTSVDQNAGKVTIKDKNGTTHEFQATPDMARTMKPGDRIEATLREAPRC